MPAKRVTGACLGIEYLVLGYLDNNVYLVDCGNNACMVVDPSCDADAIMEAVGSRKVEAIMCTHYHSDHTGAAAELRRRTGAPVIASRLDAEYIEHPRKVGTSPVPVHEACTVDVLVDDRDRIDVGEVAFTVFLTPGHSEGSMCWYASPERCTGPYDPQGVPVLLSGDTLFNGCTGRTDFVGGSSYQMARSMATLAQLPDETLVLPGHNGFTTIARERQAAFRKWGIR